MQIKRILTAVTIGVAVVGLAACSSKGNSANGGGGVGPGGYGADGYGYGADGQTYAQGNGEGYYNDLNCNVTPGAQAYYFDFDSNVVHSEDRARIQALAQNANATHENLRVVGNTDNRGSREYNVALGWRRADAVSSTLQQYGVSPQQISTTSNGAEKPIAYGNTEQDYQCNRRVDAKVGG